MDDIFETKARQEDEDVFRFFNPNHDMETGQFAPRTGVQRAVSGAVNKLKGAASTVGKKMNEAAVKNAKAHQQREQQRRKNVRETSLGKGIKDGTIAGGITGAIVGAVSTAIVGGSPAEIISGAISSAVNLGITGGVLSGASLGIAKAYDKLITQRKEKSTKMEDPDAKEKIISALIKAIGEAKGKKINLGKFDASEKVVKALDLEESEYGWVISTENAKKLAVALGGAK